MGKPRAFWATLPPEAAVGKQLGYASAQAALRVGLSEFIEEDSESNIAIHLIDPEHFVPIEGKVNVLLTMWESYDIPSWLIKKIDKADYVLTCSKFCLNVLREHLGRRIWYCPLGVDTDSFSFHPRKWDPKAGETFTWLCVGTMDPRKSEYVDLIWRNFLEPMGSRVRLLYKTTGVDAEEFATTAKELSEGREVSCSNGIVRLSNLELDTRFLTTLNLVEVMHQAHGYLSLHSGEGFGLPTLEALATGLPVVVTDYSGTADFCSKRTAFPVKAGKAVISLNLIPGSQGPVPGAYLARTRVPILEDVGSAIRDVMVDYEAAMARGARGAALAKAFSWRSAAKAMLKVIKLAERHN